MNVGSRRVRAGRDLNEASEDRAVPYLEIALCIVGIALFANAGKLEAQGGAADHSVLWGALSLLVSVVVFALGGRWVAWLIAQIVLFVGIAIVRVVLDDRGK